MKSLIKAIALSWGLLAVSGSVALSDTFLKMSSMQAGSPNYTIATGLIKIVQDNTDIKIQLSAGETQTKAMLQGARGRLDMMLSTPFAVHWMKNNAAMYQSIENAPEMAGKLRNILSFPLGTLYVVVRADSGIKTYDDLKGKRVFMGPPGSGGYNIANAMIAGSSGLKAGEDFEVVNLDWTGGTQAFQDGNVDAYLGSGTVPTPLVEQFALGGKVRFLSMPESAYEEGPAAGLVSLPGFLAQTLDVAGYDGKVVDEGPVNTIGMAGAITTHVGVSEDVVYEITKAVMENLDDLHAVAAWLKQVNRDTVMKDMNLPLHAGTYNYFKEIGLEVPEELIPPESKG